MSAALVQRNARALAGAAVLGLATGLIAARMPLAAVGLMAAAAGVVIVTTRADLVLLAMIAALPWENKLHYPSAEFSTVKGIGAIVLLAYVLQMVRDRRAKIQLPWLVGIVAALLVWVGVSFVAAPDPSESTTTLVRWLLLITFFFLVIQLIDGRVEIRRAMRWFATSVTAAAVYALVLFVGHHGKDFRAAGPLQDPNDFAYLLACTLPIVSYLAGADRRRRPLWVLAFLAIAGAMLATLSRGALVGVGALLVWGIVTRRIPLWVILGGLVSGLVVVALAFTLWKPLIDVALHQKSHVAKSNTESREVFWGAAIQLGEKRPVTGVGPGRFPTEATPLLHGNVGGALEHPVTHNTYLEILAEEGIPALLLFLAYLAGAWMLLRKVQARAALDVDRDLQRLATALQASLVLAVVSAFFLSEELTSPFWLLGGLAVALALNSAEQPAASEAPRRRLRIGHAVPATPR
ncbi:MAG TPA: O-antigen ligase family protein [Solirubrobacteraceae bacterium]